MVAPFGVRSVVDFVLIGSVVCFESDRQTGRMLPVQSSTVYRGAVHVDLYLEYSEYKYCPEYGV